MGGVFQDFRPSRNVVSKSVTPGHHQSLRAAERRHGHFRTIVDHIIGNRKANWSTQKVERIPGDDYDSFKSHVQQFGGFSHGQRVLGGILKCRSAR